MDPETLANHSGFWGGEGVCQHLFYNAKNIHLAGSILSLPDSLVATLPLQEQCIIVKRGIKNGS
jgi:hypothetical protein